MARLVISWKTIRFTGTFGWSTSSRCQAMDSPSRSSSVASSSWSASSRSCLSLRMCSFLSSSTTYRGRKSFWTSTPRRAQGSFLYLGGMSLADRGRSRMCPIDDSTTKPLPRKPAMVRALAGDSTMTRDLLTAHTPWVGTPRGSPTEKLRENGVLHGLVNGRPQKLHIRAAEWGRARSLPDPVPSVSFNDPGGLGTKAAFKKDDDGPRNRRRLSRAGRKPLRPRGARCSAHPAAHEGHARARGLEEQGRGHRPA